uniref:FA_desaturase domain-containing protein n=1 Tax=Panagrellus redivivus TaxID=6233 RepID=A0A7E4ZSJ6_PANRE
MVLREQEYDEFHIKVNGKWILVTKEILHAHPGGTAITTYKDRDATTVFHTFHAGSKVAYKQLQDLQETQKGITYEVPEEKEEVPIVGLDDVNMGVFDKTEEESKQIIANFDKLRLEVRRSGLLNGSTPYFISKFFQCIGIIGLACFLQYHEYYVIAALLMGLAWQQLGWMVHEYCHHQHFADHYWNDMISYIVGNFLQGFSAGGWKEQHNVHHAATNVVGRDGDLDLLPFWATVASDLKIVADMGSIAWQVIPYQHLYWSVALPFLRLSWLLQSILFVTRMEKSEFDIYRERARHEQVTLAGHWILVALQLYMLPDNNTRLMFFFVSQLFGGFLLAHVVTYNHYSADKFPNKSRILENYPCLQLYTTRNMRPGIFIDWLWGGLNYQIEHHLFPTMPRHNLSKVMPMVKEFCRENDLPYMVDDYLTGWRLEIEQFQNVAIIAQKMKQKIM